MNILVLNIPIILTLSRIIFSPFIVLLFAYFLPFNSGPINLALGLIFAFLSLTDFLDGYLARRYAQETLMGRLLDPIADKFLLFSTLIVLVYVHKLYFYWAIIFIGREFFVMSLRQMASAYGFSLSVMSVAKLKTAVQMIYLLYAIINPYHSMGFNAPVYNSIEYLLLATALYLSLISAFDYYLAFIKKIRGSHDVL